MAIAKEKWKDIEVKLKAYFVHDVKFKLGEDILSIQRERNGESKTVLAVYINGTINFGWGWCDSEKFNPLTSQVWRKVFKPYYSKQKLAAEKKKLGVRLFNQVYSKKEQTDGITYYSPCFSSSRTLISLFKKIEGIEYLEEKTDE